MPINRLEHVLVISERPKETRDFYVKILGMKEGYRPPFPFPGYWLYLGNVPCIHLAGKMGNTGQTYYLGKDTKTVEVNGGTGAIDHIAFVANDVDKTRTLLKRNKIEMRERLVPEQNMIQVFFKDPNDITIELNFPIAEQGEGTGAKTSPAAPSRRRAVSHRAAPPAPRRRAKAAK